MTVKTKMECRSPGLRKAIGLAGSVRALAVLIDRHISTVEEWKRVPTTHVAQIVALFPGEITRRELRPDLFELDEK